MKSIFLILYVFISIITKAQIKPSENIIDLNSYNVCKYIGHIEGKIIHKNVSYDSLQAKPILIDKNDSIWIILPSKELRIFICSRCRSEIYESKSILNVSVFPNK